MQGVPAHAVPAGPLAVRWVAYELASPQAGTVSEARVELENAGTAAWRDILISYHWLDDLGNPIDWDGLRAATPDLAPGERAVAPVLLRAPIQIGRASCRERV